MNTKEAAIFWGVSQGHVCKLCAAGRVKSAVKIKGRWHIHPLAAKPFDRRFKSPGIITLCEILWRQDGIPAIGRRQIDCPQYRISDTGLIEIIDMTDRIYYMKKWGLYGAITHESISTLSLPRNANAA